MMLGYRTRLQLCLAALIANAVSLEFPPNANHIFNSIHSSMRQWGSSLNHNGMSFYLATVPEGTQLYHGDAKSDPIQGPEWLAFEAEHALVFAHPRPPHPHGPPGGKDGKKRGPPPPKKREQQQQQILGPMPQQKSGYLHTFAAAKDLRLLYVDGMSAGKTDNGTMDTQDYLLFRNKMGDGGGMMGENKRAELFCEMVKDKWEGTLDGVLRMEAGFEIILCDFSTLDVLQVARVKPAAEGKPGDGFKMPGEQKWLPAVASRYWNIGGDRVILDYEQFVTAYTYGLDLFPNGEKTQPRLRHLSTTELAPILVDLDSLILGRKAKEPLTDWQTIADMVVERYGARLRFLASGQASSLEHLQEEIEDIVTPFIDYDRRNRSLEVDRCSRQFVKRSTPVTSVAADAVLSVSRSVCATLLDALSHTEYDTIVAQIQGLMDYLGWTTWKYCNGCGDHEICMIPMWPMGTVDDYEHPRCRDYSKLNGDGPRYWGGHGPPPKSDPSFSF
ncbi:uncharacterized protein BDV14DRAFT_139376 [Aspergillus stella-maris]|uniref:uncharacterized protein n=1 Tax=Aspergillus stella-maris TaxID=1810926 RepID=UPI003CCE21FC